MPGQYHLNVSKNPPTIKGMSDARSDNISKRSGMTGADLQQDFHSQIVQKYANLTQI